MVVGPFFFFFCLLRRIWTSDFNLLFSFDTLVVFPKEEEHVDKGDKDVADEIEKDGVERKRQKIRIQK